MFVIKGAEFTIVIAFTIMTTTRKRRQMVRYVQDIESSSVVSNVVANVAAVVVDVAV
jgi:hypothetical protein